MEIRELVHRPVVTCETSTPLKRAAELMSEQNVGSVVVLDRHGTIAGIVTDRDVAVRGIGWGRDPAEPVALVMSTDVIFVYERDDVFLAATKMAEHGLRRLPILDAAGHVAGMITLDDLLLLFGAQMDKLTRAVGRELHTAPASLG